MSIKYRNCLFVVCWTLFSCCAWAECSRVLSWSMVKVGGELKLRLEKNMQRLEEAKYQPSHVYLTMEQSGDWPGDTEGRTILGLVLDAQSSHRNPVYLDSIIDLLPTHLNEQGYMGPVFKEGVHEQQLSGNGWLLRGLCEYWLWKQDDTVLKYINDIATHLFLPAKGKYAIYPIDPEARKKNVGKASGSISQSMDGWYLSTDIGCVFIGMDGLIQAYGILKDYRLKPIIEEMIERFLDVDLLNIKAQTHATLTACRGLIRYAEITGKQQYIKEAEKRFLLYLENGLTENFENYNWFGRFDTWTEPCAIVDSYMLAVQLWQHTGKMMYLELAEKIYYNALCRTQRYNGGFGCDNCPGQALNTKMLTPRIPEAHWCCTMCGGEGLSRAASYTTFVDGKNVFFPFFRNAEISLSENFIVEEKTNYPFGDKVTFLIRKGSGKYKFHFPHYSWLNNVEIRLNGVACRLKEDKGFYSLLASLTEGDVITITFERTLDVQFASNRENTQPTQRKAFWGPLQLGYEGDEELSNIKEMRLERRADDEIYILGTSMKLVPIYHLFSPKVWEKGKYPIQILF